MFCVCNGLAPGSNLLAPKAQLGARRAAPTRLPRPHGKKCQALRRSQAWFPEILISIWRMGNSKKRIMGRLFVFVFWRMFTNVWAWAFDFGVPYTPPRKLCVLITRATFAGWKYPNYIWFDFENNNTDRSYGALNYHITDTGYITGDSDLVFKIKLNIFRIILNKTYLSCNKNN